MTISLEGNKKNIIIIIKLYHDEGGRKGKLAKNKLTINNKKDKTINNKQGTVKLRADQPQSDGCVWLSV